MERKHDISRGLALILDYLLNYGDLILIAVKGHGKTLSSMRLADFIAQQPNNRLIIVEHMPQWSRTFIPTNQVENIAYMVIPDSWIVETRKAIDIEDYFLSHERSFTIKHGEAIRQFLRTYKHCIFRLETESPEKLAFFTYAVCSKVYRKQYKKMKRGLNLRQNYFFILEESQNTLDSQVLTRKYFGRFRTIFSNARNLNMHFIATTQRMTDVNTKFRCRMGYAIGKPHENDLSLSLGKLMKFAGGIKQLDNLKRGEWYFTMLKKRIRIPKYEPIGEPNQFVPTKPELIPKKHGFVKRFLIGAGFREQDYELTERSIYDKEDDLDEEMELDLGLLGEPDEEW